MTTPALQAVIVGAGLMGRWHLEAARRAGAHVVCVIDPDLTAAHSLARRAPKASVLGDIGEANFPLEANVAHVCTPVAFHREVALSLLARGLNVIVEKPIAPCAEDVVVIVDAAEAAGLYVCPTHQYAFQPGIELSETLLRGGLTALRIDFDIRSAGAMGNLLGRADDVVSEILPHPLSILQIVVPDTSLDAVDWQVVRSKAGEYTVTGLLGKTLVTMLLSMEARPTAFKTRVLTANGELQIDGFHGYGILLGAGGSRGAKICAPFDHGFRSVGAAAINLASRALRSETAYPGLNALTRRFYTAIGDPSQRPISMAKTLSLAKARDYILREMRRAGSDREHG